VDANGAGRWYIHTRIGRPGVAPYTHYLGKDGTWLSACVDRWPSMEEAIQFAKNGPQKVQPQVNPAGYWTVASMIECLRKYPQKAVILGAFETYAVRSGLKVASDNDADPTKATTVYIEVLD
jgi:hypothetical protein